MSDPISNPGNEPLDDADIVADKEIDTLLNRLRELLDMNKDELLMLMLFKATIEGGTMAVASSVVCHWIEGQLDPALVGLLANTTSLMSESPEDAAFAPEDPVDVTANNAAYATMVDDMALGVQLVYDGLSDHPVDREEPLVFTLLNGDTIAVGTDRIFTVRNADGEVVATNVGDLFEGDHLGEGATGGDGGYKPDVDNGGEPRAAGDGSGDQPNAAGVPEPTED